MKKKLVIGICLCSMMLFACGNENNHQEELTTNYQKYDESGDNQRQDTEETSEKVDNEVIGDSVIVENETGNEDEFTKDKALLAVQKLWGDMKEYMGKDYFLYSKLFVNTPEENIQKIYSKDLHIGEVDKTNYVLIGFDYPYAHIQIDDYMVSGQHPNTKRKSYSYIVSLEYTDEGWRAVDNDEASNSLVNVISNKEFYHEGFMDAMSNGRNVAMFGKTYMYLDSTAVYDGCLDNQVFFAWQQEDGAVCIGVWLVNGTDQNIAYKSAEITLTSDSCGEVLAISGSVDWTIRANTSMVKYIVVDASEIKTGMQAWGGLSSNISTRFN